VVTCALALGALALAPRSLHAEKIVSARARRRRRRRSSTIRA
jgi:hypothetical protein